MRNGSGIEIANDRVFFNGKSLDFCSVQEYLYEEHWDEAPDDANDIEAWLDFMFKWRRDVKNLIQKEGEGVAESFFDYNDFDEESAALNKAIANLLAAAA